jgi:hypothetical protein
VTRACLGIVALAACAPPLQSARRYREASLTLADAARWRSPPTPDRVTCASSRTRSRRTPERREAAVLEAGRRVWHITTARSIEVAAWGSATTPIQPANAEVGWADRDAGRADDAGKTIRMLASLELAEAEQRYACAILKRCEDTSRPSPTSSASATTSSPACSRRDAGGIAATRSREQHGPHGPTGSNRHNAALNSATFT